MNTATKRLGRTARPRPASPSAMRAGRAGRPRPASPSGRDGEGFTLIELLTVVAIMLIIMGITAASLIDIGRGARMRAAVSGVTRNLRMARQYAITHNCNVTFSMRCYSDTNTYYFITNKMHGLLREKMYFPPSITGIVQRGGQPMRLTEDLVFQPDGTLRSADTVDIIVGDGRQGVTNTITIRGLTGMVKVGWDI